MPNTVLCPRPRGGPVGRPKQTAHADRGIKPKGRFNNWQNTGVNTKTKTVLINERGDLRGIRAGKKKKKKKESGLRKAGW